MRNRLRVTLLALLTFSTLACGEDTVPAAPAAPAAPSVAPAVPDFAKQLPAYKSGEPAFAFNRKDLDGWYTYLRDSQYEDPKKVFTVVDGMLRISGQDFGGITTKQAFKNYHLVAEWKWGDKTWELPDTKKPAVSRHPTSARDAGILVHGVGKDDAAYGFWLESIEVQIIEGGVGDFIVVSGKTSPSLTVEARADGKQFYFEPGGSPVVKRGGRINWWGRDPQWKDTTGYRGPRDVEKPHGQWNRLDVLVDGDTITTLLNGLVVNRGTQSSLTEGKIQLQSEGAEIFFRKVEVRPLISETKAGEKPAPDASDPAARDNAKSG